MGCKQKSRRKLAPNAICYLCCERILPGQAWNRDHVPPERFYGTSVKRAHSPQLDWLPTHTTCNESYKADEELFFTSFAPHTHGSYTGDSAVDDLRRGFAKGHSLQLGQTVLEMYGKVVLADGSRVFRYNVPRTQRLLWKMVRGIYALQTDRPVPKFIGHAVYAPFIGTEAEQIGVAPDWYSAVHNTGTLGKHGAVLDYRWIGWSDPEANIRGDAMILLFWDRLVCPVMFHDPTCTCSKGCVEAARRTTTPQ